MSWAERWDAVRISLGALFVLDGDVMFLALKLVRQGV